MIILPLPKQVVTELQLIEQQKQHLLRGVFLTLGVDMDQPIQITSDFTGYMLVNKAEPEDPSEPDTVK